MNIFKICSLIIFYFISRVAFSEKTRENFTDPEHQITTLNPTLNGPELTDNRSQKIFLASDH